MQIAPIPVCRPLLPSAQELLPYLETIDATRWYSNSGPLQCQLRDELAGHFRVPQDQLVLASSGTSALIGTILATVGYSDPPDRLCLCPAYTFVATAAAARSCGYLPFFVDVDPITWALDPERLVSHPSLGRCAFVLLVAPYGRWPDLAAWQAFTEGTGVPVILDAAGCFDTLDSAQILAGSIPVSVSLHATKTFSTAEGGLVITADSSLALRVERALNFGFHGSRESQGPCTNGKLSEYHAAVGLAELQRWPAKRWGFLEAAATYRQLCGVAPLGRAVQVNPLQASPYALYQAPTPEEAAGLAQALQREGIGCRRWYGDGLHRLPLYRHSCPDPLPVTDTLAACLLGLPMAMDLNRRSIEAVVEVLKREGAHRSPWPATDLGPFRD